MSWTTYPIGRPQRVCAATGAPLSPGEQSVATLLENRRTGQVERKDFSLAAWNGTPHPVARRDLIASWRVTVPAIDERPKPILDDDAMLDLFEQLGEEGPLPEPGAEAPNQSAPLGRAALRLVLTLMMMRRRLLVQEGNRGTSLLVRPRGVARPAAGGPALIEVKDPGLDASMINDVLGELESLGVAEAPDEPQQRAGGAA
ncbi:MAG: hypothetical protein K2X91_12995 [Thermoleophilia bacterium]|nr:hypothetical protein [Thermoleophilia bacterium]